MFLQTLGSAALRLSNKNTPAWITAFLLVFRGLGTDWSFNRSYCSFFSGKLFGDSCNQCAVFIVCIENARGMCRPS